MAWYCCCNFSHNQTWNNTDRSSAMILLRLRRYINRVLTYLLAYLYGSKVQSETQCVKSLHGIVYPMLLSAPFFLPRVSPFSCCKAAFLQFSYGTRVDVQQKDPITNYIRKCNMLFANVIMDCFLVVISDLSRPRDFFLSRSRLASVVDPAASVLRCLQPLSRSRGISLRTCEHHWLAISRIWCQQRERKVFGSHYKMLSYRRVTALQGAL